MPTTRVMPGIADQTGEKVNSLRVEGITSRTPLRYAVQCEICSARTTESHQRLVSGAATCRNSSCGKSVRRRDRLEDENRLAAERENQRRADELAVSAARMDAELDGYERPTKYAPTPDPYVPMTAREVSAARERREQLEAEERERQRPAREAAEKAEREQAQRLAAQHGREQKRQAYWREWVQSGRDPQLYVTAELLTASMPAKEASAHNEREVAKFIETTPDFAEFKTPANADKLIAYFDKNGVRIFDAAMLKAAFVRLRDLGILAKRPAPQPQPMEQPKRVNLSSPVEPTKPITGPKVYRGRDYATGREREFTQREVDRMSSLEFQRAFEIVPTVGELFTRMREER